MSNDDMKAELEQLRKQVAELSAARKQQEAQRPPEKEQEPVASGPEEVETAVNGQVEELLKLLQDEVRDMPAITTLTVFALGILMGRFLR